MPKYKKGGDKLPFHFEGRDKMPIIRVEKRERNEPYKIEGGINQ